MIQGKDIAVYIPAPGKPFQAFRNRRRIYQAACLKVFLIEIFLICHRRLNKVFPALFQRIRQAITGHVSQLRNAAIIAKDLIINSVPPPVNADIEKASLPPTISKEYLTSANGLISAPLSHNAYLLNIFLQV